MESILLSEAGLVMEIGLLLQTGLVMEIGLLLETGLVMESELLSGNWTCHGVRIVRNSRKAQFTKKKDSNVDKATVNYFH